MGFQMFSDIDRASALVFVVAVVAIFRIVVLLPTLWRLRNDNSAAALAIRDDMMFRSIAIAAGAAVNIIGAHGKIVRFR